MAQQIKITFKDGSIRKFPKELRIGSGSVYLELKNDWATVTDEWKGQYTFPAETVAEIETIPDPRGF